MAQHDYDIANQAGAAFRADLNAAMAAIVSMNSGATEPAETFPHMFWADTTAGKLKQRNAADSAWIVLLDMATGQNLDTVSQAEAEAGSATTPRSWTAQRVKQVITANSSSVQIQPISASVAANQLIISAPALSLDFRSATLTSGAVTRVSGTPANLVVPANATLGTISGAVARLIYIALNNAGTIELAVVNQSGGTNLDETGVISTTAISAASNSANVVYSTTARTNVAYRVIGYLEETSATAGQWNTLGPFSLQGSGGQALTSMHSIGQGQTWQNVSGSRTYGTTYYNTTGKPICVKVAAANSSTGYYLYLSATVNGLQISNEGCWAQSGLTVWVRDTFIVPPGGSYSVAVTGVNTPQYWSELR